MARKNKPNHGSLNLVRGRYYYKVTLPGTNTRKTLPLVSPGHTKSTTEKRLAIALANRIWDEAEQNTESESESNRPDYDGTLTQLKELFVTDHKRKIAGKQAENKKREIYLYTKAIKDLIEFLTANAFTLITADLKPNRILLWRNYLNFEKGVCRNTINKKVNVIKQMIRYAANYEIESAELYYQLAAILPLKRGEENSVDHAEVEPADWLTVQKLFPYLDEMIADMLSIARYTGARPGEIRLMRVGDIDRSDPDGWVYRPPQHKTIRFNHVREIVIGERAQRILTKYLLRSQTAYCFPPKDNRRNNTKDYYSTSSFAKHINRAVKQYNIDHPKDQIEFHAHQLRHTFGTEVCEKYGIETAKNVLGHATVTMTKRYTKQAVQRMKLIDAKRAVQKLG